MKACLFALLTLMGGVIAADGQTRVLTSAGEGIRRWSNGVRIAGPTGFFNPFPELDRPRLSTADADLTGDGVPDIIVGASRVNQAPLIGVFDGVTAQRLASWTTGDPAGTGVSVAAGDVDGDGFADIVVGSSSFDTPAVVRIYSGRNGTLLVTRTLDANRYPYGVEIAAGDVNGDGLADLVLASWWGVEAEVFVIDVASGDTLLQLTPYPGFGSGLRVAVGDVNGDGFADVVTAPAIYGGPHVRVFDGRTGGPLASFFAYAPSHSGGVRLAAGDFSGDGRAEIVTFGPQDTSSLGPGVTIFDLAAGTTPWPGTYGAVPGLIGGWHGHLREPAPRRRRGGTHVGPFRSAAGRCSEADERHRRRDDRRVATRPAARVHTGMATLGDARPDGHPFRRSLRVLRIPLRRARLVGHPTSSSRPARSHRQRARRCVTVDGPA